MADAAGSPAMLVLDASALLAGKRWSADTRAVVPRAVLAEVEKRGRDERALAYLVEAGLDVREPSAESRERARAAARKTGDLPRLSATDVDVLAVALEVQGRIVTDDYSIQNVASSLALGFDSMNARGIRAQWTWRLRCIGCHKFFEAETTECDVCGSLVKPSRAVPGQRRKP